MLNENFDELDIGNNVVLKALLIYNLNSNYKENKHSLINDNIL